MVQPRLAVVVRRGLSRLGKAEWVVLERLVVLFFAVLVLRRIPAMLLLYHWVPEIDGWREALFSGHFGEPKTLVLEDSLLTSSISRPCKRIDVSLKVPC